jgi:hypothetical protein
MWWRKQMHRSELERERGRNGGKEKIKKNRVILNGK